jgi:hypothetical protein
VVDEPRVIAEELQAAGGMGCCQHSEE